MALDKLNALDTLNCCTILHEAFSYGADDDLESVVANNDTAIWRTTANPEVWQLLGAVYTTELEEGERWQYLAAVDLPGDTYTDLKYQGPECLGSHAWTVMVVINHLPTAPGFLEIKYHYKGANDGALMRIGLPMDAEAESYECNLEMSFQGSDPIKRSVSVVPSGPNYIIVFKGWVDPEDEGFFFIATPLLGDCAFRLPRDESLEGGTFQITIDTSDNDQDTYPIVSINISSAELAGDEYCRRNCGEHEVINCCDPSAECGGGTAGTDFNWEDTFDDLRALSILPSGSGYSTDTKVDGWYITNDYYPIECPDVGGDPRPRDHSNWTLAGLSATYRRGAPALGLCNLEDTSDPERDCEQAAMATFAYRFFRITGEACANEITTSIEIEKPSRYTGRAILKVFQVCGQSASGAVPTDLELDETFTASNATSAIGFDFDHLCDGDLTCPPIEPNGPYSYWRADACETDTDSVSSTVNNLSPGIYLLTAEAFHTQFQDSGFAAIVPESEVCCDDLVYEERWAGGEVTFSISGDAVETYDPWCPEEEPPP